MSDPFKLHADYMKGVIYEGRRHYLHHEKINNGLQPPAEFMTKQQARAALKVIRDKASTMERVDFYHILKIKNQNSTGKPSEGEVQQKQNKQSNEKANKRMVKQKKLEEITIEKFSSFNPEDWTEHQQAGCHFYVNHATGEVSDECPWGSNELEEGRTDLNDEFSGTGAKVYDNEEFENFMKELDSMKPASKKK